MEKESKGAVAAIKAFFSAIGVFFSGFGTAVAKGDIFVKLTLLWWGAGYVRRKQYVKAAIMTIVEAAIILFTVMFAFEYVPKFGTLGTVKAEKVLNPVTMKSEFNDYDHSFKILLFSLFSFVVWFAAIIVWMKNMMSVYKLQQMEENGEHINTFKEDARMFVGEKFHITLLTLPVIGIIVFTVIPILLLVFVAFTNYDQQHTPPAELYHTFWWRRADSNIWILICTRTGLDIGVVILCNTYYLYWWYSFINTVKQQKDKGTKILAFVICSNNCSTTVRITSACKELFLRWWYCQYNLRTYTSDRIFTGYRAGIN